jgi:hypothetical protein
LGHRRAGFPSPPMRISPYLLIASFHRVLQFPENFPYLIIGCTKNSMLRNLTAEDAEKR